MYGLYIQLQVLNLIITGIPSIPIAGGMAFIGGLVWVLNLIITGIPSILERRYDNIWKDIEF